MFWKTLFILSLSLLMFALGFLVGGVHWDWRSPAHAGDVAFWSMLGGWVSGLATLAAVIVSMYMAYQASQSDVEKLRIQANMLKPQIFGNQNDVNVRIQNLRNFHARVTELELTIDNSNFTFSLNHIIHADSHSLPHLFEKKGDFIDLQFSIDATPRWSRLYDEMNKNNTTTFKKAKFLVHTHLKKYYIAAPQGFLPKLKESSDAWKKMQESNAC